MKRVVGRPFKKGVSGNPKGKPKMDPELRALRTRSRADVEKIVLKLYDLDNAALNKILDEPTTSFWEKHIARIILRGVAKGELEPFLQLSDYIFGKRAEPIEISGPNQGPIQLESLHGGQTRQDLVLRILERSTLLADPKISAALKSKLMIDETKRTQGD